jgi:hypothetical protein
MTQYSVFLRSVLRLLVTANLVPSSPILPNMMMDAICSSETSALITGTRRHIPEDGILHRSRVQRTSAWTEPLLDTARGPFRKPIVRNEVFQLRVLLTVKGIIVPEHIWVVDI